MAIKGFEGINGVGRVIDEGNVDFNSNLVDSSDQGRVGVSDIPNDIFDDFELDQFSAVQDLNRLINTEIMNSLGIIAINDPIDVSDLPDDYRFQGYTATDNYIYITAHDNKKNRHDSSVILVYDHKCNYLGKMFLPVGAGGDAHVGGVSYDSEHNILYITGRNGDVLVLDNELIEDAIGKKDIPKDSFDFELDDYDYFRIEDLIVNNQDINLFDSIP